MSSAGWKREPAKASAQSELKACSRSQISESQQADLLTLLITLLPAPLPALLPLPHLIPHPDQSLQISPLAQSIVVRMTVSVAITAMSAPSPGPPTHRLRILGTRTLTATAGARLRVLLKCQSLSMSLSSSMAQSALDGGRTRRFAGTVATATCHGLLTSSGTHLKLAAGAFQGNVPLKATPMTHLAARPTQDPVPARLDVTADIAGHRMILLEDNHPSRCADASQLPSQFATGAMSAPLPMMVSAVPTATLANQTGCLTTVAPMASAAARLKTSARLNGALKHATTTPASAGTTAATVASRGRRATLLAPQLTADARTGGVTTE